MAKTFSFNVKSTPEELLKLLKKMIEKADGIEFSGNERSGSGSGKGFEGTYKMHKKGAANKVDITITKKPWLIPWSLIESKLSEQAREW